MSFFQRVRAFCERILKKFTVSRPFQTAAGVLLIVTIFVFFRLFIHAPKNFPVSGYVEIENGETISQATIELSSTNIIDQPALFKLFSYIFGGRGGIKAGYYYFPRTEGVLMISYRFARGDFGIRPVKITVPEGSNVRDIATILKEALPNFDSKAFVSLARRDEGYLFPDTYFFLPTIKSKEVVEIMEDNFNQKIKTLENNIAAFGRPQRDVITMASILEEEARLPDTRQKIAGILWKRIDIGMPLQVDSVFPYIFGGDHFPVSLEDLKFESPYNTYLYKGLPPGPISNPGLISISAAVNPIESKYLYYLTDQNGVMHYAVTHDEHIQNKAKYLR